MLSNLYLEISYFELIKLYIKERLVMYIYIIISVSPTKLVCKMNVHIAYRNDNHTKMYFLLF